MEQNPSSSRADRKTIEKNRRNHMKALYSKLNSLVPHQNSMEPMSLPDQLDEAAKYIKKLQKDLEKMNQKKESLKGADGEPKAAKAGLRPPHVEIHEMGCNLEVVLITRLECQFMFNETIKVLHEEGADIGSASFSVVDDTVFHTIRSKVGESAPGDGAARIRERLKKLICDQ
ncbi:hypothetical protein NMG60_11012728 [Bertholletia excelsa]